MQTGFQWIYVIVVWHVVSFQELPSLNDTLSIEQLSTLTFTEKEGKRIKKKKDHSLSEMLFQALDIRGSTEVCLKH